MLVQETSVFDIRNCDCMIMMKEYPDKHFELAICDPPYGRKEKITNGGTWAKKRNRGGFVWDKKPNKKYFNELLRVSVNQIIWGGNYFTNLIPISRGWIVWDKITENFTAISNELAWSSFDRKINIFRYPHGCDRGFLNKDGGNIHPTEKPVALYEWLLTKYAKKGDKILDTHIGSGSIALACHNLKFDLVACELDKDYYEAALKRINFHIAQKRLF